MYLKTREYGGAAFVDKKSTVIFYQKNICWVVLKGEKMLFEFFKKNLCGFFVHKWRSTIFPVCGFFVHNSQIGVKSSDSEESVNHSAADKVSAATQVVSRGSARPRYLRVSNGRASRKQLCTRYRQMRDRRQSNGVSLVPYQSSSESDSDDSYIQIPQVFWI